LGENGSAGWVGCYVSIYPHFTLAATPADQLEKAMMEGYMIAEGRRVEESEYVMRVVGIMRIYFLLLNGEEGVRV